MSKVSESARLEHPLKAISFVDPPILPAHHWISTLGLVMEEKGMAQSPCLLLFKPDYLRVILLVMNVHTLPHNKSYGLLHVGYIRHQTAPQDTIGQR